MLPLAKAFAGLGLVAAALVLVLVPDEPNIEWIYAAILSAIGVSILTSIDKEDLK